MSNPPKKKGTGFEAEQVPILARVWPDIVRASPKGNKDHGDFDNVDGWLVEAKKAEKWLLPLWIAKVLAKVDCEPWFIVFANDRRRGLPTMVAMPRDQYVAQLEELYMLREWRAKLYDKGVD